MKPWWPDDLRTHGFAVLPPHTFLSPAEERMLLGVLARRWGRNRWRLKRIWKSGWSFRDADARTIHRLVSDRVLEPLQNVLNTEGQFMIEEVFVRAFRGSRSPAHALHADEGYAVFVYPFDQDGPLVYLNAHAIRTPPHAGVVLSGMRRQAATGTPAIIHASPASRRKRFALIAVIKPRRDPRIPRHVRLDVARRIATLR